MRLRERGSRRSGTVKLHRHGAVRKLTVPTFFSVKNRFNDDEQRKS